MRGRFLLNLDGNWLAAVVQQGVNEILADAVEFNAHLVVRSFGSGLVEVEDQCAAAELKRVALLNRFQQTSCFLCGSHIENAVTQGTLKIESKDLSQLPALEQPIRPVRLFQGRIKVALEDALALIDLGGNPLLQLVEGREVAHLRVTFHLNQVARNRPGVQIQVEQPQVGALQTDGIVDIVRFTA